MAMVYLETSVISHATAWPSHDPVVSVLQDQARQWFADEASKYELVTSQFVIDESSRGDPIAVERRLALLAKFPSWFPTIWWKKLPARSS